MEVDYEVIFVFKCGQTLFENDLCFMNMFRCVYMEDGGDCMTL